MASPGASQRSSQKKIRPWMMWEKLYQSVSCCEVSGLKGSPTHSRMCPLAAIKGWPKVKHRRLDGDQRGGGNTKSTVA